MLGNGVADEPCNTKSCCYDHGDYTAWMQKTLVWARYLAISGNSAQARVEVTKLCILEPQLEGGNRQQHSLASMGCTFLGYLKNGLDIFGRSNNDITPLHWEQYGQLLESYLRVVELYDGEISLLQQHSETLAAIDMSAADAMEAINSTRAVLLQELKAGLESIQGEVAGLQTGLQRNTELLEQSISGVLDMQKVALETQQAVVINRDVMLEQSRLILGNNKRLLDETGRMMIDLRKEIAAGTVSIAGQLDEVQQQLVDQIRSGVGYITDVVVDGTDIAVMAVMDGVEQVIRTGALVSEQMGMKLKMLEGQLVVDSGTVEDIFLQTLKTVEARVNELYENSVKLKEKLAKGPDDAWDADGDTLVSITELVDMMYDGSLIDGKGRRMWAASMRHLEDVPPEEVTRRLLAKKSRKSAKPKKVKKGEEDDFLEEMKEELISAGLDWAVEEILEPWAKGALEDDEGFDDYELVDLLSKVGSLYDDGKTIWEASKDALKTSGGVLKWGKLGSSTASATGAAINIVDTVTGGELWLLRSIGHHDP